jgi:hypothetical protein
MIESSGKVTPKYASIKLLQIAKPVMFDEYIQKSLMTAIEALEKQIPKKPINNETCPNCGADLNEAIYCGGAKCCAWCGQAIDWEVGEDE